MREAAVCGLLKVDILDYIDIDCTNHTGSFNCNNTVYLSAVNSPILVQITIRLSPQCPLIQTTNVIHYMKYRTTIIKI